MPTTTANPPIVDLLAEVLKLQATVHRFEAERGEAIRRAKRIARAFDTAESWAFGLSVDTGEDLARRLSGVAKDLRDLTMGESHIVIDEIEELVEVARFHESRLGLRALDDLAGAAEGEGGGDA